MLTLLFLFLLMIQGPEILASPVTYQIDGAQGEALLYRPQGKGPFPTVVFNHALIVDNIGYQKAAQRGYDLQGVCQALAKDGFLAFAPLRQSGPRNIPRHKEEVLRAVDYVKTLAEVDPSRIALMGLSRGGLLTLMVGTERSDLKALVILAPSPGGKAVKQASSLNAPVLLLVEASDDAPILENFDMLEKALRAHGKENRSIRYHRGGGHLLFYDVNYYWDDVRTFLREKLGRPPAR